MVFKHLRTLIVFAIAITLVVFSVVPALAAKPALNNGLALTPPMGWNSWNIFYQNINETQIKQIADVMVSSGMKDAGYVYLNLDDNWMATSRDSSGNLRADPTRFPSGMKALGDYIHSKGLKFGIYGDHGLLTCYHYYNGPSSAQSGSYGKETRDANTYASWGVDYLKYDNCDQAPGSNMQTDYTNMKNALASSGRSMVFSICAWAFQSWMPATGNLWRTTGDIANNWNSMIGNYDTNVGLYASAAPGAWNDPDMLEVGNGGMTDTEYRTHMSLWAIMAAPLIAGNDIRTMSQATKDILMAPEIIAVDQDALGKQGQKVSDSGDLEIISKQLSGTNVRAVALFNRGASAANITVTWSQIGLPAGSATVRDLWARVDRGSFTNSYTVSVPSHGTAMLKIVSGSSGPTPTSGPSSSVEAEAGTLSGAAVIASCASCSGGSSVGYIGNGTANYVTLNVIASAAGNRTLTIYGLVSGTRSFSVSINGGAAQTVSITGTSWTTPIAASPITVALNAGNNTVKLYNDTAYAPDLDRIVIGNVSGPTPTTGPTTTPTRTPTPIVGASPTPTIGVSPTPTTPVSGSTCSPVTSTITAPFTYDGAGTFCWQSTNLGSYVNSWNATSITVNGVNVTNIYVASGSYPAKINGFWYVSYNSSVAWAHFEAK